MKHSVEHITTISECKARQFATKYANPSHDGILSQGWTGLHIGFRVLLQMLYSKAVFVLSSKKPMRAAVLAMAHSKAMLNDPHNKVTGTRARPVMKVLNSNCIRCKRPGGRKACAKKSWL